MLKMWWLFHLFFICLLSLAGASQESIELLNLCETTEEILQTSSYSDLPVAVLVDAGELNGVSTSILSAETWLRSHVLAHYPATKITTIVVGRSALCRPDQEEKFPFILPSLKNVYNSLRWWGLENEIKVSVAFYLDCFHPNSASYNDDLKMVKPLVEYLRSVNSTYSIIPHRGFSDFSDKSLNLVSSQLESLKKVGFFDLNSINVIAILPIGRKPRIRKLSVLDSDVSPLIKVKPPPLSEIAEPPLHSSTGYPIPAYVARKPMPPWAQIASPPTTSSSSGFAPKLPPFVVPASAPHGFGLPPCNPIDNGSPKPEIAMVHTLWCVAKPSVPAETLKQAMDYACGEGGAECEEITPNGSCYNPDSVVAHASYAFNSYWQKHKRNGGTCSFGGTAMLINSDPSFRHCRFVLS